MSERVVRRVEDLEVFERAYRLSLELHQASLEFPRIEQFALADQLRRASRIDLREPRRRLRQAGLFCGGISALPDGRDRQQ